LAAIRARVKAARARQSTRFANTKDGQGAGLTLTANADMGPTQVRDHCPVDETGRHAENARRGHAAGYARAIKLSARAYTGTCVPVQVSSRAEAGADDRGTFVVLRAGRAGSERIQPAHIAMSISDRPRFTYGRPRRTE